VSTLYGREEGGGSRKEARERGGVVSRRAVCAAGLIHCDRLGDLAKADALYKTVLDDDPRNILALDHRCPPPLRTNRTRRVLHPVLIGHAARATPASAPRRSVVSLAPRTARTLSHYQT
jgi:hypothetical protein